jgi:6-phosphogluconolactonase
MRPSRLIVEHETELGGVFSRWLEQELGRALHERGRASLALPGGSAARACLPRLAETSLDWSQIHLFWGDERAVPPDDPESNYALARQLLITPARVPAENVHRMPADSEPLARAASAYEALIEELLGSPPRLDVAWLGMGPDGHVCSLFPGHAVLNAEGWVAAVTDSPKPPKERLTLTLKTLAMARVVALSAFGSEKAAVVREVCGRGRAVLPAARALASADESVLFLDREAAALLDSE